MSTIGDLEASSEDSTCRTLLERLQDPTDDLAMSDFVQRYAPRIYRWCIVLGAQPADAEDVTHNIVIRLIDVMKRFQYDRSKGQFRGWLYTVTKHAWFAFCNERSVQTLGMSDDDQWLEKASIDDFQIALEKEFDREVLDRAIAIVRTHFPENHWRIYQFRAIEQTSAKDVGARMGIPETTVNVYYGRFVAKLKSTIQELNCE